MYKRFKWILWGLLLALVQGCVSLPMGETTSSNNSQLLPNQTSELQSSSLLSNTPKQAPLLGATNASTQQTSVIGPANPEQAAREYKIGPQDLLDVSVFGVEQLSRTVRVNSRGLVSLPLIGTVEAQGLTAEQLEQRIATRLSKDLLQNPSVTIFIKEYASQRVTLDGALEKPGIYALSTETSLLQAVAMAGGLSRLADSSDIRVFRRLNDGKMVMGNFDLDKIRTGEARDPVLEGNDVVVVGRSSARVFLSDSVFRDAVNLINPFSVFK